MQWSKSPLVQVLRVHKAAQDAEQKRMAQQLAGHAGSRMTKEVYTHVTDAMLNAAAEAIERATDATAGSPGGSPDCDKMSDGGEGLHPRLDRHR